MKRHWSITTDAKLSVTEQICQKRNIDPAFLHLTLADLPSEKLLANIEAVADRIRTALYRNEPLVIFGHDDPDGITSAYILYRFLETCGYQKHHYYIPNRNLEPHGIQASFLQAVKEGKYPLIITVDNGISALEGVQALNQMGCEVIITDHHLVQPDQIPQAVAILNPQLPESRYPYKMLAGVGVVLMLIRYLSEMLEHKIEPALYFWTAIGSIADKVPMTGVNWILVRHVIEHWDELNDSTIQFLQRNYTRISTKADKMGFMQYCSRLIANGREVGGQHIAMRFMLQLSDEKARLFQLLEEEKNEWESALNGVFKLVDTLLTDYEGDAFIYYDDEDLIPYSLLGTAATYVVNNLDIPVIMLKNRHNMIVCEGRCNSSFNIVEAFTYCKSALIQFGGHAKAAGFTMQHDKYNDFIDLFHEYILAPSSISKQPRYLEIDAVVNWSEVGNGIWSELDKFTPYGQENLEPVIVLQGCTLAQINEKFLIDNNSSHLPTDQLLNVAVQFKNHSTLRILDHRSAGESN
jgi:single-stranded-DNA-specific exonuclease